MTFIGTGERNLKIYIFFNKTKLCFTYFSSLIKHNSNKLTKNIIQMRLTFVRIGELWFGTFFFFLGAGWGGVRFLFVVVHHSPLGDAFSRKSAHTKRVKVVVITRCMLVEDLYLNQTRTNELLYLQQI